MIKEHFSKSCRYIFTDPREPVQLELVKQIESDTAYSGGRSAELEPDEEGGFEGELGDAPDTSQVSVSSLPYEDERSERTSATGTPSGLPPSSSSAAGGGAAAGKLPSASSATAEGATPPTTTTTVQSTAIHLVSQSPEQQPQDQQKSQSQPTPQQQSQHQQQPTTAAATRKMEMEVEQRGKSAIFNFFSFTTTTTTTPTTVSTTTTTLIPCPYAAYTLRYIMTVRLMMMRHKRVKRRNISQG